MMDKAKIYTVPSFSEKGKTYTVRFLPYGDWKCSCPYFVFRENQIVMCKHIEKVIRMLKKVKYKRND